MFYNGIIPWFSLQKDLVCISIGSPLSLLLCKHWAVNYVLDSECLQYFTGIQLVKNNSFSSLNQPTNTGTFGTPTLHPLLPVPLLLRTRTQCQAPTWTQKKAPKLPTEPNIIMHNWSQWEDPCLEWSQSQNWPRSLSRPFWAQQATAEAAFMPLPLSEGLSTRNKLLTDALLARATVLGAVCIAKKDGNLFSFHCPSPSNPTFAAYQR